MANANTKLSEAQERAVMMLRYMGRTEQQALEYVLKEATESERASAVKQERKMTASQTSDDGGRAMRRAIFAKHLKPLSTEARERVLRNAARTRQERLMTNRTRATSTARLLTEHNARREHDEQCCAACASSRECR